MKRFVVGRWKEVMTVIHYSNKMKEGGYDSYTVEEVTTELYEKNKHLFDHSSLVGKFYTNNHPDECFYNNTIPPKYISREEGRWTTHHQQLNKNNLPPLYLLTLFKENQNDKNPIQS